MKTITIKTKIYKNKRLFDKRGDRFINGVDKEFAKENKSYKKDNNTNFGCWNCKKCQNCMGCYERENLKNLYLVKNKRIKLKGQTMNNITLDTKITLDIIKRIRASKIFIDWFIKNELENCSFIRLIEKLVEIDDKHYLNYLFKFDMFKFDIDVEALEVLSSYKDSDVKGFVSRNKNTPIEILDTLSRCRDSYSWIKEGVAGNKNTGSDTLEKLSKCKDWWVKNEVAKNKNASKETLEFLSRDKDYGVILGVARNKNTSKKTLKRLSKCLESNVVDDAIENLDNRYICNIIRIKYFFIGVITSLLLAVIFYVLTLPVDLQSESYSKVFERLSK